MTEGRTCYERDEVLCEDRLCVRFGCKLKVVKPPAAPRQFRMTAKQQRICDLLTLGKSSKEIAFAVGVNVRTIEDHRREVFKKVGVRNAVELTRKMLGAS